MPIIKISGLDTILAEPIITNALGYNTVGKYMQFSLYQGSVVTKTEIASASTIGSFRLSDLLYTTRLPSQSKPAYGLAGGNSAYVKADASGTATWFMLCGVNEAGAIYGAVAGDVSDVSGNGQLKLLAVDIHQGWMYRVPNLSAIFPYSFAY